VGFLYPALGMVVPQPLSYARMVEREQELEAEVTRGRGVPGTPYSIRKQRDRYCPRGRGHYNRAKTSSGW
jgi:hypothetical protein